MYNGIREIELDERGLADFYEGKYSLIGLDNMKTNEYLLINPLSDCIKKRWNGNSFVEIKYPRGKNISLKPKTIKQEFLADLICNKEIPVKIITGVPGSGKSRLAIFYGLHFLSKGDFAKIFLIRHNAGIGERNGYLPGSKEEKIMAWLGFFKDNISEDYQFTLREMIDKEMVEVDGVEYMKGRDLKNSFIIVDESEDLTIDQFRVLGERVSTDSVICFIGDFNQTTQEKYKKNNGLLRATEVLPGLPEVGFISFDSPLDNMRGNASKIFSSIY